MAGNSPLHPQQSGPCGTSRCCTEVQQGASKLCSSTKAGVCFNCPVQCWLSNQLLNILNNILWL